MLKSCTKHRWTGPQSAHCPLCPPPRNGSTRLHRRERDAALHRDGHRCTAILPDGRRCPNTAALHADHVLDRALGGADSAANYRTLCESCHKLRHGRTAP